MLSLPPYPLPESVLKPLLELASSCGILVFGEMHGTQEVPRVLMSLLPELSALDYRALALEIPADNRDSLANWGRSRDADEGTAPVFFAEPAGDGRDSREMLAFLPIALANHGWELICFDCVLGPHETRCGWAGRDALMAHNFCEQRARLSPNDRILAVCGNMHSRLVNDHPHESVRGLWPPFAAQVQESLPEISVASVDIVFHSGASFNGQVREIGDGDRTNTPRFGHEGGYGHTAYLHLPTATAATFLREPSGSRGGEKK